MYTVSSRLRFNVEEIMVRLRLRYVYICMTLTIALVNLILASIFYSSQVNRLSIRPSNNRLSSGSKSYMLSIHYAEQLTNAASHYIEFINLVADWNLTGVEPYIHNSRGIGSAVTPAYQAFHSSRILFHGCGSTLKKTWYVCGSDTCIYV